MAEALERLLMERFFSETRGVVPTELHNICTDPDLYNADIDAACSAFHKQYQQFKESIRMGNLGKTPQFWLIYLDLMNNQFYLHTAVQENDFKARLTAWDSFIPFYFAMSKANYAR